MIEFLTAEQARDLMIDKDDLLANECVAYVLKYVEAHATAKKYEVKIRDKGFGNVGKYPAANIKAIEILKSLGYKAERQEEYYQFADVYLLVSWAEELKNA